MTDLIEKYGRGNAFMTCACVLEIILIILTVTLYNVNITYNYKGNSLKLISLDTNGLVMRDSHGNRLVMTVDQDKIYNAHLITQCEVQYLDESISYTSNLHDMEVGYTFSDGSFLAESAITITINGNDGMSGLSQLQAAEKQLISRLCDYYRNNIPIFFYIVYDILGFLFLLFGNGLFFYPENFWKLQTLLTVQNGEPTDWAIFSNKIGGVIIIVLTFVGLFYIF